MSLTRGGVCVPFGASFGGVKIKDGEKMMGDGK
jgi:hypothetical protein